VIIGLFMFLKREHKHFPFISINTNEKKKEKVNRKDILEKLQKNEITLEEAMKKMNGEE